jgi:hypothetical protein
MGRIRDVYLDGDGRGCDAHSYGCRDYRAVSMAFLDGLAQICTLVLEP